MSKPPLFTAVALMLAAMTQAVSLHADEPAAITIKVNSGGRSFGASGATGGTTNGFSAHTLTHFVDSRRIGVLASAVKQPEGKWRLAYVILVKHELKNLEESSDFPASLMNDGKQINVTQAVKFDQRELGVKYTARWKSADRLREQFRNGDHAFDLKSGRVFLVDLTAPEPQLKQVSEDLTKDLLFPDVKPYWDYVTFAERLLTNAKRKKSTKAFMKAKP